jgi:nucleoside-diphosphate-sugar epimerase
MRILITGASGFIGSYLFKEFTRSNHETYGLVRKKPLLNFLKKNKKKIIISDLLNFEKLNKLIPKNIDIIIHAGAYNDQDTNKDVKKSYLVNIYGTRNICKIATDRKVKKLVYFSVLQVYGRELKGKINENSKIICDSDYSLNHFLSEEVCKNYSKISKVKFSILRLGYIFGCPIEKKIDRKSLIPFMLCEQAVKKSKINLMTKGRARRDFVSLKTLFFNLKKIIKKNVSFNIYNFASGYSYSIKEIIEMVKWNVEKIKNKKILVNFGNVKDKINLFNVSSKLSLYKNKLKITKELNYEIKKTLYLLK